MSDTTPIDIGHGLTAALRLADGLKEHLSIEDGVPVGVLLTHACSARSGAIAQDFIPVAPYSSTGWTLENCEPITLSPSVKWTCCGVHGFVQQGKWVPTP